MGRLDILANTVGISPAFVSSDRVDQDDWSSVLEVKLTAPFACSRAALPLLEAGGGSVVSISSVRGARAHERLVAYAASKGRLEMVTETLAAEWASRCVRVNSLAPGFLETDMTTELREHPRWGESLLDGRPMRRFGTPGEVTPAVPFLAADASWYATGRTLYVDGGWTA